MTNSAQKKEEAVSEIGQNCTVDFSNTRLPTTPRRRGESGACLRSIDLRPLLTLSHEEESREQSAIPTADSDKSPYATNEKAGQPSI